jgi:hypothetical protein
MFDQNKRKIDSRIRFQNPQFKTSLRSQRNYKRIKKTLPQTPWGVFLSKIGLGSWPARITTLAIFFLLVYIVFIPNIFFVKTTIINNPDRAGTPAIQNLVNSFLNKKLPWPEKNLLVLSRAKLRDFLLKNDGQILQVDKITKKFPSTLIITIIPRVDQFALQTQSGQYYSLSNDGKATNLLLPNASNTLPSALILIKLTGSDTVNIGGTILSPEKINYINGLQSRLANVAKSQIDYYELADLQTPDLTVYLKNSFLLKFDFGTDLDKTLNELNTLLTQLAPGDIKKLYYLDMRFLGRGYACYLNTPCAQNLNLPKPAASSTPSSLGN